MKNLFFAVFMVVIFSGCGALKPGNVANEIAEVAEISKAICDSARILSAGGIDVPGVEQCEKIMPQLNSAELAAIVATLNCASTREIASKDFAKCAIDAGWDTVKTRITELSEAK